PYRSVFVYSPCHNHYHIDGFSNYQLLNLDGTVAAQGHKQAFCLEDLLKYTNDNKSSGYTCAFQGITTGWADWYFKQLSGQWIVSGLRWARGKGWKMGSRLNSELRKFSRAGAFASIAFEI